MKKLILSALAILGLSMATALPAASTVLNTMKIVRSGYVPTPVAVSAATPVAVTLTAGEFLRVTNPDASVAMTWVFTDQRTNREGYKTDATFIVPAAKSAYTGPFIKSRWADGNGLLQGSFTGSTQPASVEAMRLPYGESEATTK